MLGSAKKVIQVLLAVVTGAAVSFGATLAVAAPAEPLSYCAGNCVNECIEAGFAYGRCSGDVCVCFPFS
ncbi:hypothetical protein [Myxococcus qinghaiensis]|uniref:hypothetical protein n=1 Tax=Myxococcus qinghaiensis TaxID=2906758 RepID=UPI0020A82946|nr:hypothetical protein [Myxococcus qinghaiensis]